MLKQFLTVLFLTLVFGACQSQSTMIDKSVVKDLDIEKYLGTWYELARYDHSFERGLVGVTATYSMRQDGKIKVVNAGYHDSLTGERSEAIGKAKIPDTDVPSKLKVSFFWIFYADYYVLELDDNYQWAIIGSKSDSYLWILSRKPVIDDKLYNELIQKAGDRGYDTDLLIKVEQTNSQYK